MYSRAVCMAEPNSVPFCGRHVTSRYFLMIRSSTRTCVRVRQEPPIVCELGFSRACAHDNPPFSRPPATWTRALLPNLISDLPVEPSGSGHLLSQTIPCSSACLPPSELRRESVTYPASGCVGAKAISRQQLAQPPGRGRG